MSSVLSILSNFVWVCGFGLAILCGGTAAEAAATTKPVTKPAVTAMPTGLLGQWQVIQVAVDGREQPSWPLLPDDPQMMGRLLTISPSEIGFDSYAENRVDDSPITCKNPTLLTLRTQPLQRFFGKNNPRPPAYRTPPLPTLADFDLHMRNRTVSPLRVRCGQDRAAWGGIWFVPIKGDLLVGKPNSGSVLVLRKLDPTAPIRASFDCAKASHVVERTICSSRTLANYDRSVASAYRHVLKADEDDRSAMQKDRQGQRDWLKTRNACGANKACLAKSMRWRIINLMQSW